MTISWHGLGCVEILSKESNGEVRTIINPYTEASGLRLPRTLEAQLLLASHRGVDADGLDAVGGKPFMVMTPGEYEVGGVFVYAISAPRKDGSAHHIFRVETEGVHIAHLGAIDRALTEEEIKSLGDIDILLVPIGGKHVIDPEAAMEAVQAIEPRLIVPIYYGASKLGLREESVAGFLKEAGAIKREEMGKLKIGKSGLPEEDMKLIVLTKE